MFLDLVFLVGVCLSAPINLDKIDCTYADTSTPPLDGTFHPSYSVPLTAVADNKLCKYYFTVEMSLFSTVNVVGLDMQAGEFISVFDHFTNTTSANSSTYNATTTWPSNFEVYIQTRNNTNLKFRLDVNTQKTLFDNNIKNLISTEADKPSTVLYFEDLKEGETYSISSVRDLINIKTALALQNSNDPQASYILNNIFLYQDTSMYAKNIGTMLTVFNQQSLTTPTKTLAIYIAKPVSLKGAILLTDTANLDLTNQHTVAYVPLYAADHSDFQYITGDSTYNGALTVIGEKDGSTPIQVRQLTAYGSTNRDPFSYVSGGPILLDSLKTPLNIRQLPVTLSGNLNTLYIANGWGTVKYTIS